MNGKHKVAHCVEPKGLNGVRNTVSGPGNRVFGPRNRCQCEGKKDGPNNDVPNCRAYYHANVSFLKLTNVRLGLTLWMVPTLHDLDT